MGAQGRGAGHVEKGIVVPMQGIASRWLERRARVPLLGIFSRRIVAGADTYSSLSLSAPGLAGKKPRSGAFRGAHRHLLAGFRRARGCGFCRSRVAGWGLFERRCRFPLLAVAFEEAPSCVPSCGGVSSAERRGPTDPELRRSPIACVRSGRPTPSRAPACLRLSGCARPLATVLLLPTSPPRVGVDRYQSRNALSQASIPANRLLRQPA